MSMSTRMLFRLIICLVLSLVYAEYTDIGSLVPEGNRDLGNIPDDVTERKIINAFIRNNPNLPEALRRPSAFYVIPQGPNRALISVSGLLAQSYAGWVEVIYNGGPPVARCYVPANYGPGKLNIATIPNLQTNFHNPPLRDNQDEIIIEAFMANNPLPIGLQDMLQVTQRTANSARLSMKRFNSQYEGDVVVHFSVQRN